MLDRPIISTSDCQPVWNSRFRQTETWTFECDAANLRFDITRVNGVTNAQSIHVWTVHGGMQYIKSVGERRWTVGMATGRLPLEPPSEARARTFAGAALAAFDAVWENLPADHLPGYALANLESEDRDLVHSVFPEAFAASEVVCANFGEGLLALAREIVAGRDFEIRQREEAEWHRRVKKQFKQLPNGTVLVHRDHAAMIGVISNAPGRRTKRSLKVYWGTACIGRKDLTKALRTSYRLMTPEQVAKLPRSVFSSHEILVAVGHAGRLAAHCPDLA
ncbi:hypothetical protein [Pararhodobacter sp. SW119]|uniref:hypothetical protein n=1 Tax=Pararhodobacter sp. SW119 TaxID=2780075 RepID=UPI001AE02D64|nr:hypothetical protein [Pararhodobacter sp. SW119]